MTEGYPGPWKRIPDAWYATPSEFCYHESGYLTWNHQEFPDDGPPIALPTEPSIPHDNWPHAQVKAFDENGHINYRIHLRWSAQWGKFVPEVREFADGVWSNRPPVWNQRLDAYQRWGLLPEDIGGPALYRTYRMVPILHNFMPYSFRAELHPYNLEYNAIEFDDVNRPPGVVGYEWEDTGNFDADQFGTVLDRKVSLTIGCWNQKAPAQPGAFHAGANGIDWLNWVDPEAATGAIVSVQLVSQITAHKEGGRWWVDSDLPPFYPGVNSLTEGMKYPRWLRDPDTDRLVEELVFDHNGAKMLEQTEVYDPSSGRITQEVVNTTWFQHASFLNSDPDPYDKDDQTPLEERVYPFPFEQFEAKPGRSVTLELPVPLAKGVTNGGRHAIALRLYSREMEDWNRTGQLEFAHEYYRPKWWHLEHEPGKAIPGIRGLRLAFNSISVQTKLRAPRYRLLYAEPPVGGGAQENNLAMTSHSAHGYFSEATP